MSKWVIFNESVKKTYKLVLNLVVVDFELLTEDNFHHVRNELKRIPELIHFEVLK